MKEAKKRKRQTKMQDKPATAGKVMPAAAGEEEEGGAVTLEEEDEAEAEGGETDAKKAKKEQRKPSKARPALVVGRLPSNTLDRCSDSPCLLGRSWTDCRRTKPVRKCSSHCACTSA